MTITRISRWRFWYWAYVTFDCERGFRDHQFYTKYFVAQWPAHRDDHMVFSERLGYRRALHIGKVCISRRRGLAERGFGHTLQRFSAGKGPRTTQKQK